MSEYTDAISHPGRNLDSGSDERALFLQEFGGKVLLAYEEAVADYDGLHYERSITQGKADSFPVIGRKRDAYDHDPGELIVGGSIEHGEVVITLDKMLVDSAFIAEIDELMSHYNLMDPYTTQLGQSLGSTDAKRIAALHILASRAGASGVNGIPTPSSYTDANVGTDGAKMEDAVFTAVKFLKQNDISGSPMVAMWPWQQYLLLARYSGIEGGPVTTGTANRASGTVGLIAGIPNRGTNHIPSTNITTGLSKYQGDFSHTIAHVSSQMAVGTLNRRGLRIVMKQQDERLGTLMIASQFNGHGILRAECGYEIKTA